MVLLLGALTLMAVDYRHSDVLRPIRTASLMLVYPLLVSVDSPHRFYNRTAGFFSAQTQLALENAALKEERRWKDSNVELPKEDTDGNALLVICRYSGEWARAPFGIEFSDEFVRHYSHWMNAPEMPEVQE